jgi:WD40 repeat protein
VSQVILPSDGTRLATASHDGTAKIWGAATGQELAVLRCHDDYVWRVAFGPHGTRLDWAR